MEWELGSRTMNDLESENNRFTALGTVSARLQRACRASQADVIEATADELLGCIVIVEDKPDNLYYVYDAIDDDKLLAHQIEPPLNTGTYDVCLIPIEDVVDWTEWDEYKEVAK
jgi:hypothetical protein